MTNILIDWQNYQDLLAWAGLFPERNRDPFEAADTLLLTIPNQLGVDYNAHLLDSIVRYVAPELGWR